MKSTTAYTQEDAEGQISSQLGDVMETCNISQDEAITLMRNFHWSVDRMQDEWFSNQEKVRMEVGIQPKKGMNAQRGKHCLICWNETSDFDEMICGHSFCIGCWR